MNRHTAKALLQDAFYQVLDNKVFRILVIVSLCLILPTFLIAFTPTEVNVLFGWKVFKYSEISWLTGIAGQISKDLNVLAIQGVQRAFVDGIAGSFGIMLALAATAFFVPRMLEKGEADTLFSKPTGRFVLLMARYTSGILFVGVLAFVLVLGMHAGFLLRSGYSDPAFIWSALTLVYIFALVHAFSTLVGVLTRSSITALLAAIVFFGFNGCVHQIWINKEHTVTALTEQAANEDKEASSSLLDMQTGIVGTLIGALDTVHYALPKTSDAAVITSQLRRAVSPPEYVLEDPAGGISITKNPEELRRRGEGRVVDLATTPATWGVEDAGVASLTIRRVPRAAPSDPDKPRSSRPSDGSVARDFVKTLEKRTDLQGRPEFSRDGAGRAVRVNVRWKEKTPDGLIFKTRAFFSNDDWTWEFDFQHDERFGTQEHGAELLREFLFGVVPQRQSASELDPGTWYSKQVGWKSPLRYNTAFSIGSSLAFALIMLLLARWRLSRIDF